MAAFTSGAASSVIFADLSCATIRQASGTGTNWQVAVIAGTYPNTGHRDGADGTAEFSGFAQIAQDSAGNIYVADTQNEAIRKMTFSGLDWNVSTLAGGPSGGLTVDGTNGGAQFTAPIGVAVDNNSGNIYVLQNNYCIRQIVQQGTNVTVTTIAGKPGVYGYADAIGTNALFNTASQIATDSSGNIYLADRGNYAVRRLQLVCTNWVVTTLAGLGGHQGNVDGTGSAARFGYVYAITVDNAGAVYVSDLYYQTIRKGVPATPLQILTSTANFNGGQLSFNIAGPYKETVVVWASGDLQHWSPVWTNVFGLLPLTYTDSQSGNYTRRFYHAAVSQ